MSANVDLNLQYIWRNESWKKSLMVFHPNLHDFYIKQYKHERIWFHALKNKPARHKTTLQQTEKKSHLTFHDI